MASVMFFGRDRSVSMLHSTSTVTVLITDVSAGLWGPTGLSFRPTSIFTACAAFGFY